MRREGLYVRSIVLDGLPSFIKQLGGNPARLAREAGLNLSSRFEKGSFQSWGALCDFFERAATEMDEPYLGLKWAQELPDDFRTSGPNILIALTVKDVREFLDLAIEYQNIHTNGLTYSYAEDPISDEVVATLSIHPLSPPRRQYTEHIVGTIAQMCRRHMPDVTIKRVSFQHRAPADVSWYETVIGCPIEFNADETQIITDRRVLDIKLGWSFAIARTVMQGYLKHILSRQTRSKTSVALTVSGILPSLLGVHKSDMASIASCMDINPKKLQRLLKDEDTSYSKILDETRRSLADRLLLDSDIAIGRIARALDYQSTEAFIAASQRWFGIAPSKYRSQYRGDTPSALQAKPSRVRTSQRPFTVKSASPKPRAGI